MTEQTVRKITGFLGLCMRAGRIVSGQEACVDLVRRDEAALVLMDAQSSENTRKRLMDACHNHGTPLWELPSGEIGQSIGKRGRMVVALSADGMADHLLTLLRDEAQV